MKNTALLIAFAAAIALSATQSFAQAQNFEGFSAGLDYNSAQSSTTYKSKTGFLGGETISGGGAGQFGSLQAQYAIALNESFVLGIGATVALNSYSLGSLFTTLNVEGTQKQQWSLDIMPGFAITDSILAYGRASYINASAAAASISGSTESSITGTGYGVGLKVLASKNIYWHVDYVQNTYANVELPTSISTLSSNIFSLGVGYKF